MRSIELAVLLVLAGAIPAAASCMGPQTVLAPASGSLLPENPSLFLFVPSYHNEPTLTAWTDGGEVPIQITLLSKARSLRTYRLDVKASAESSLTVRVQDPVYESFAFESHFDIAAPPPPIGAPISILSVAPEISSWMCSFQESHNVALSGEAPAFRVEWSGSESDYKAGIRRSVVVPADMNAFYGAGGGGTVLELGHVNCFGYTLQWTGSDPLYVGFEALHADGSVQPISTEPMELSPPERPFSQWLMQDYIGPFLYTAGYYIDSASEFLLP